MKGCADGKHPSQGLTTTHQCGWCVQSEGQRNLRCGWKSRQARALETQEGFCRFILRAMSRETLLKHLCQKASYTLVYRLTATVRMLVLCFTENPNSTD